MIALTQTVILMMGIYSNLVIARIFFSWLYKLNVVNSHLPFVGTMHYRTGAGAGPPVLAVSRLLRHVVVHSAFDHRLHPWRPPDRAVIGRP